MGRKILVIDDNSHNLYFLEVLLKGAGYDVVTAENGLDALEKLRSGPFDGIVSDVLMPLMDGFKLIRACKKDPVLQQIPFIFYTATYTEKRDEEFGLSLGAIRYIIKPAEPDALLREIQEAFSEHESSVSRSSEPSVIDDETFWRGYIRRVGAKLDKKTRLLQESEEKFRTVVENVPDIILVHKNGNIVFVNTAIAGIMGYRPDEVIGQHIGTFVAKESLDIVNAAIREVMAGRQIKPYTVEMVSKSGSRLVIVVRGSQIDFEGVPATLNVLTDITERKLAEEKIHLVNRKLALMRDVTYQDIKNKITALRGYTELAKRSEDEEDRDRIIGKEEKILESIHGLIESTRDYQKMGEDQSCWIPVEQSVKVQFAHLSRSDALTLECNLNGLELYVDPLFNRVVFNLMQNASQHGGKTRHIVFTCEESPQGLLLVCADDGIGVPVEDKARIFNRIPGGPGKIGLFFIREYLEISGMSISETGTPGNGARFEISIPKGLYRFCKTAV
jgi:PAS domain S-box-containing protein